MTRKEYVALYKKHLSGRATPQEEELLNQYADDFDINLFDNEEEIPDQDEIKQRIFQNIESRMADVAPQSTARRYWWLPVAASILLVSSIGFFYINGQKDKLNNKVKQVAKVSAPILPGTNKAVLILGNGDRVDLNAAANGRIAQAGALTVNKLKNGQLEYGKAVLPDGGSNAITYNTIITPRGGQYQVTLPDGTSVWLNSASSLKYPTAFTGSERHVELTGEAYFEVAKNKQMPFTVDAGKVGVKVLGTHFNIAAYEDDPATKTTLLEGSVKLTGNQTTLTLTPGQQGVATKDGHGLTTKTVNVEDAVAWKNGYFSFRKENLQASMRKIARWYDVDVVYQGKMNDKLLGGSVLRTQSINEILGYLETIGIAKFKVEGRRIMVKPD
ncbi:FecR family protein [Mucilaginibacter pedocola]|uniref:Iron dicitrate transport regulator FecR n=1 Tax=Mucilaginibacter pedocola TaxID=1792845 RepID=A0A1S9PD52_9SPHI|nr:FecR family protein [Mucilaginibacter pedocola]OOQ58777.1 hypothetical protein BC343_08985 [Mucilaginibacter pedocola]